jgi:hypothetical protein
MKLGRTVRDLMREGFAGERTGSLRGFAVRVSERNLELLEALSRTLDVPKSTLVRRLLACALEEALEELPEEDRRRVLGELGRSVEVRGVAGERLLAFAGVVPGEELAEMERAIEEHAETVDPGEW